MVGTADTRPAPFVTDDTMALERAARTCVDCNGPNERPRSAYCSEQCADRCANRIRQERHRQRRQPAAAVRSLERVCEIDDVDPLDDVDPEIIGLFYDLERWRNLPNSARAARTARQRRRPSPPGIPFHPDYDT